MRPLKDLALKLASKCTSKPIVQSQILLLQQYHPKETTSRRNLNRLVSKQHKANLKVPNLDGLLGEEVGRDKARNRHKEVQKRQNRLDRKLIVARKV